MQSVSLCAYDSLRHDTSERSHNSPLRNNQTISLNNFRYNLLPQWLNFPNVFTHTFDQINTPPWWANTWVMPACVPSRWFNLKGNTSNYSLNNWKLSINYVYTWCANYPSNVIRLVDPPPPAGFLKHSHNWCSFWFFKAVCAGVTRC